MEYFLITILELLGICFHVGQKVLELDKKSPDDTLGEVFAMFWKSDRVTLFISALILALNLVAHFIIAIYGTALVEYINSFEYVNYEIVAFTIAFLLGYFGQRKIYELFGKLEKAIDNKIQSKLP